ncbi:MAG: hypothetical protein C0609_05920, partial [Deltaproteobacteria bacterium]
NSWPEVYSTTASATLEAAPALTVSITPSANPVAMGAPLTLFVAYSNEGNYRADSSTLTVALSEHVAYEYSVASLPENYDPLAGPGGSVEWSLGDLAPGEGGLFEVHLTVKTPAMYPRATALIAPGTQIINIATLAAANAVSAATSTSTVTVGTGPNVVLAKSQSDNIFHHGEIIAYTLVYENIGNEPATQISISDAIPAGTTYLPGSATAGGSFAANTVTWSIPSLAPGESGSVGFEVTVDDTAPIGASITNQGEVTAASLSAAISNPVTGAVILAPEVSLTLTPITPTAPVGGLIVMEGVVTNTGNQVIGQLTLTNPLPGGTSFISANEGGTLSGGVIGWDLGAFAPGETKSVTFQLLSSPSLAAGTVITSTATLDGVIPDTVKDTATVTLIARTDATITFTDNAFSPVNFYSLGDDVCIRLEEPDLNVFPGIAETADIKITSTTPADLETLTLIESGPDTGIFTGCIPTSSADNADEDGVLSAASAAQVTATHTDPLDDTPSVTATVIFDPSGVVFNAVTGQPVRGAKVTLLGASGAVATLPPGNANPVTTGLDGYYAFPALPSGEYRITVDAGAMYTFPSVTPDSALDPSMTLTEASRGIPFTLGPADIIDFDIPLDPVTDVALFVSKEVSRATATIGEVVRYTLTVENTGDGFLEGVTLTDALPKGIHFKSGSATLDGETTTDPAIHGDHAIRWALGAVGPGDSHKITFVAIVGADAHPGILTNRAFAEATSAALPINSNIATADIKVSAGIFSERGTIIGKVFIDGDCDTVQDEGEEGVKGIAIYMEDGRKVVTDEHGLYSIPRVKMGTHVLALDRASLPKGLCTTPASGMFMGDTSSQFVDMGHGSLVKANFTLFSCAGDNGDSHIGGIFREETAASSSEAVTPKAEAAAAALKVEDGRESIEELENRAKAMQPGLGIIEPKNADVMDKGHTRILIKTTKGLAHTLTVNDEVVTDRYLRATIEDDKRGMVVTEYRNVPLIRGRENIIKLIELTPGVKKPAQRTVRVKAVGDPSSIEVTLPSKDPIADGFSAATVKARILDRQGLPVTSLGYVTVDTMVGEIADPDFSPENIGHQIPCAGGTATFTVRAPENAGKGKVIVTTGETSAVAELFFAPELRDMLTVGYGELYLGPRAGDGAAELYGRGAFFARGEIAGDLLLTAAYDSEGDEESLFSPDSAGEEEEALPTYGDGSENSNQAPSSDKLYVRLDKGRSHLLYGDFETAMTERILSAYKRTLTGAELEASQDELSLYAFASLTSRTQVVDELRAKGVSGYYYLSKAPIVPGTERITVETRERARTDKVLESVLMVRGVDYRMDYDRGIALFNRAIPSMDADFNPNYIVASYETEESGEEYLLAGGRAAVKPVDWFEVGVTRIYEEREADDYNLQGVDFTAKLPGATTIKAEAARSESSLPEAGILDNETGDAVSVSIETKPTPDLSITAYYKEADENFINPSATSISRGMETWGSKGAYELDAETTLKAEYVSEDDKLNDSEHTLSAVGVERKFGEVTTELTLAHEESDDAYTAPGDPGSREPYDISKVTPDSATTVRLGITAPLDEELSLSASHRQNVEGDSSNLTGAGVEYRYDEATHLYLRGEYETLEESEVTRVVSGVESKITDNTVAYTESKMDNGQSPFSNLQVAGLRNRLAVTDNLSADFSVEQQLTTAGPDSEDDAFAATAAMEYAPDEKSRISGRLEYRLSTARSGSYSLLGEAGVARKVGEDLSLTATARYFNDEMEENFTFTQHKLRLGLARRPVATDRFNGLALVEYRLDEEESVSNSYSTSTYLASLAGNYQLNRSTQLNGKYAGKLTDDLDTEVYTELYSFGMTHEFHDRWDIGAKVRVLHTPAAEATTFGGQVELGYRVEKNIWLSVGYAFDSFDQDLTGESYSTEGAFIKLRVKWPLFGHTLRGEPLPELESCTPPEEFERRRALIDDDAVVIKVPAVTPVEPAPKAEGRKILAPETIVSFSAPEPPAPAPEEKTPSAASTHTPAVQIKPIAPPLAVAVPSSPVKTPARVTREEEAPPAPGVDREEVAAIKPPQPGQSTAKPIEVTIAAVAVEAPQDLAPAPPLKTLLYFGVDSAEVDDKYLDELKLAGKRASENSRFGVVIEGHADSTGLYRHNMALSKKRAQAVAAVLRELYPIAEDRLTILAKGELEPVDTNTTPEGRALNRRVLIRLESR